MEKNHRGIRKGIPREKFLVESQKKIQKIFFKEFNEIREKNQEDTLRNPMKNLWMKVGWNWEVSGRISESNVRHIPWEIYSILLHSSAFSASVKKRPGNTKITSGIYLSALIFAAGLICIVETNRLAIILTTHVYHGWHKFLNLIIEETRQPCQPFRYHKLCLGVPIHRNPKISEVFQQGSWKKPR